MPLPIFSVTEPSLSVTIPINNKNHMSVDIKEHISQGQWKGTVPHVVHARKAITLVALSVSDSSFKILSLTILILVTTYSCHQVR